MTSLTLHSLDLIARSIRGPLLIASFRQTRAHSMAWRSSGDSNESLITNLARNGLIKSDRVKEAMLKVSGHTTSNTYHN